MIHDLVTCDLVPVKRLRRPLDRTYRVLLNFRKIPPYVLRMLSNRESRDPKWTRQLGVCVLELIGKYIETVDVENGISNT